MGCDIHVRVERKIDGAWVLQKPEAWGADGWRALADRAYKPPDYPLAHGNRSYLMFGVLAGVRSPDITPIKPPVGWPSNVGEWCIRTGSAFETPGYSDWDGMHSHTWYYAQELLDFDWDGNAVTVDEDQEEFYPDGGTYREMVGSNFIEEVKMIRKMDPDPDKTRILMSFDS